jgi:hypothetical protein
MKNFLTFESFISDSLNEAMTFDQIKDEYVDNPYGIGAQVIEFVDGPGQRMLVFKHDNRYDRDKIETKLKSMGFPAKKLSKSTADKAYKYPYEVTLYESELLDVNEGAIEYIDKNDKEKMIAIMDKPGYVVLKQNDFSNNQISFLIGKDQIKDLTTALNKFSK